MSSLFPNDAQPAHGVFLEHRLKHLNSRPDVTVQMVAPVPWFPWKHRSFRTYSAYARAPRIEERSGVPVVHPRFPVVAKVGTSVTALLMALSLVRTVQRMRASGFDFNVIDAYYLYPDGVAAAILARWFDVPLVLTAFGSDVTQLPSSPIQRAQIVWALQQADGATAVCEALRAKMQEFAPASVRIDVVLHGVDLILFSPAANRAAARAEMGLDGPTLLSAGLLIARKGHHIAISALPLLPNVCLMIAGSGPLERSLRSHAQTVGVSERVIFLGQLSQSRLAEVMSAVDALVLCSDREGIANVLMESMACGTPVIATPVWGAPEVVRSPSVGILTLDRSPAALADCVRTILSNPIDRAEIRRSAEQFTWASTTREHVAVLQRAVARYRSRKAIS